MTEEELLIIQKYYSKLSKMASMEETLQQSHSIEETTEIHHLKKELKEQKKAGTNAISVLKK